MFQAFYTILSLVLYVLAIPFLLFKSRNKKYSQAIPARFFLKNNPSFSEEKFWFHTCSMGETKAIKPILDKLEPNQNLSVITNTGYEEACKLSSNVRYLPFELFLPFWTIKQKALVVMEAELWYMLFLSARRKGAKTILINARISDRSYSSYKKMAWFYKHIFKNIDKIFAQSEVDKQRLAELGATNIEVIGNIKLALLPKTTKELSKPANSYIITAGSTHDGEEQIILNAYKKTQGKLIIVPRHPERFDKVDSLIKEYIKDKDISYHRYSTQEDFNSDIILVDKMGELINIYAISDTVLLSGAFKENIGGHNPIEPAYFGCKIISGKHYFNQKSLFECVKDYNIVEVEELADTIDKLDTLPNASLVEIGSVEPIINELKNI